MHAGNQGPAAGGASASGRLLDTYRPRFPVSLRQVLMIQRHGGGDPTYRVDSRGRHWR